MLNSVAKKRRKFNERSRGGCIQCKQRRKKCDEAKPKCTACCRLSHECKYEKVLYWHKNNQQLVLLKNYLRSSTERHHFLSTSLNDIHLNLYLVGITSKLNTTEFVKSNKAIHEDMDSLCGTSMEVERDLFEYYIEVLSKKKVFSDGQMNEFRSIIIPNSIITPPLLRSIMAIAASDLLRKNPKRFKYYSALTAKFKNESINLMYDLLDNPDTKCFNDIVVSLLMLCSLEIGENGNENWVNYLKESAMIFLSISDEKILNTKILLFCYRYFALRYILLLTTVNKPKFDEFCNEFLFKLIDSFFKQDSIDYMFGCSPRLLYLIYRITYLKNNFKTGDKKKAIELYQELTDLQQFSEDKDQRLINCSLAYYNAIKVYFISSFKLTNEINESKGYNVIVDNCLQLFDFMLNDSNLTLLPTWSIFIVGINDLFNNELLRIRILEIFNKIESIWPRGSPSIIRNAMEIIWKNNDLNEEKLEWRDILDTIGFRLALT